MFFKKNTNDEFSIDENTYEDYYEQESDDYINNNEVKTNENSTNNRAKNNSKLVLGLLAIILIILGIYILFDKEEHNYSIKFNLTSLGLIKTRETSHNYQINYLLNTSDKKALKFQVSNPNIVKINETSGYITSANLGQTTISILNPINNEPLANTLMVYVVDHQIPIENFSAVDLTISKNTQDIITITPIPNNTTEIDFTYQSSNPEVVQVNNSGIITGKKRGNAIITITNNQIVKNINVVVK